MANNNHISPDKVESLFDLAVRLNRPEKSLERILLDASVRIYEIKVGGRVTKLVDSDDFARWLSANVGVVGGEADPLANLDKKLEALGKEIERMHGLMADIKSHIPEVRS